jgi:hypothetical protein
LAALVTHRAREPLEGALDDVLPWLGDGLLVLGSDELGLGELGSGEPGLGDSELGDKDENAGVALDLGDVPGECGAALWIGDPQPVSRMTVAETAITGQIRFGFTSKLPYPLANQPRASACRVGLKCEMSSLAARPHSAVPSGRRAT